MIKQFLTFLLVSSALLVNAQIVQTIKGKVVDSDSKYPLIGASVVLISDTSNFIGASTDINGQYKLENVKVGRHSVKVSFIGYEPSVISDIIVSSAKEYILNVELKESIVSMKEFEVTASSERGEAMNEMAIISARQFSVEETERYAGSRGDPARMASNFAGVSGADDSRNDIVIRGNSPMGVLWRFEGIDIPNPNHFAVAGTQGGPTGVINNKYLSNSDFYTGAFPAEFGNSLAGVFDLKMRAGNNEKHEFTGQFGIFGTELMAEGPISKTKGSSYLVNYRYSTITLFNKLGIDIGTSSKLKYQDAAFKLNFPSKNGGVFSLFGIGGMSDIDIVISEQKPEEREIYGQQDRDQYFGTGMGVLGATYVKTVNPTTYYKVTLAQTFEDQHSLHQYIYYSRAADGSYIKDTEGLYQSDSLVDVLKYLFRQHKTTSSLFMNKKIKTKHTIKIGTNIDYIQVNFQDSVYGISSTYDWNRRFNAKESTLLAQPYIQWKYRATEKLTVHAGLHNQYLSLNNSYSILEPRAGLKWDINEKQSFSLGTGIHSQIQPMYIYFYQQRNDAGKFVYHNQNIGMTKSAHFVGGYNRSIGKNLRIKTEAYYQTLWNVPVEIKSSSFSLLNQGVGFSRFFPDSLKNTGTGENYGAELTIEKFFSKKFYFMTTLSLYESTYVGSDGVKRNTDFNGKYIVNVLASKEFSINENNSLSLGTRVTYAGNKWYGPVDIAASQAASEVIFSDAGRNSKQFDPYFRWDAKINYKINRKKVTHEIAFDLVNLLGTKNILKLSYAPNMEDPTEDPIKEEYQLGFLPIFYYRIDF